MAEFLFSEQRYGSESQSRRHEEELEELMRDFQDCYTTDRQQMQQQHKGTYLCIWSQCRKSLHTCRFQHCTGHITTGSWKGRGNQYIQFVRVLYCKLPTNGKQLPAFPLEAVPGIEPRPQRWEARVLPLCHRAPKQTVKSSFQFSSDVHGVQQIQQLRL